MAGNGDQAQAVSWAPLIYAARCQLSFPGSFVRAALHGNLLKPTGFGGGWADIDFRSKEVWE